MNSEEIIKLSFEYFQKIDLSALQTENKMRLTREIQTNSGLILRYIIAKEAGNANVTFFAFPIEKF